MHLYNVTFKRKLSFYRLLCNQTNMCFKWGRALQVEVSGKSGTLSQKASASPSSARSLLAVDYSNVKRLWMYVQP